MMDVVTPQPIDESLIPDDLAGFTKWRETGELPKPPEPPKTEAKPDTGRDEKGRFAPKVQPNAQESAPAAAPEQTAEPVKETPESGTGEPKQETEEESFSGKEATKRIRELLAKVKQLEAAQKPDVKAASSPAPKSDVTAESSTAKPKPQRPVLSTFAGTVEEFDKAMADYEAQRSEELKQELLQEIRNQELQRVVDETEKLMPGFKESVKLVVGELATRPECAPVSQILGSGPEWKEVTHYLGQHPDELQKLVELSQSDPLQAVVEAVHVRDKVLTKPAKAAAVTPAAEPPKVTTKAPPPPQPVSARASGAFDVNDETMNADEWAAKRTAERRARGLAY